MDESQAAALLTPHVWDALCGQTTDPLPQYPTMLCIQVQANRWLCMLDSLPQYHDGPSYFGRVAINDQEMLKQLGDPRGWTIRLLNYELSPCGKHLVAMRVEKLTDSLSQSCTRLNASIHPGLKVVRATSDQGGGAQGGVMQAGARMMQHGGSGGGGVQQAQPTGPPPAAPVAPGSGQGGGSLGGGVQSGQRGGGWGGAVTGSGGGGMGGLHSQNDSRGSWGDEYSASRRTTTALHQPRGGPYGGSGPVARTDSTPIMMISDLTPYTTRWLIKAKVRVKAEMRTYTNAKGEGRFFSIDLTDRSGQTIRATFFNRGCDRWHALLTEGKTYTFTKGNLSAANKHVFLLCVSANLLCAGSSTTCLILVN
eukprot:GHVS01066258.1.p1 GENE.GHVS01066258.1~~GHVS01066258.1.p1  ORF type:complete len:366 (-),score=42.05 GHVS01066258.1:2560-3657(-)